MSSAIALDVAYTAAAIDRMLEAYPELADDETLRADMLEGSTDLPGVMSRLVRMRQERLAHAEGIGIYIADLSERKARITRGADGLKRLMLDLMTSAQLPKLVLPEATVSVTKPRESVTVTDADALPQGYFALVRQPDKKAIGEALKAGADVPGAALETGDPSLAVRTK